ncbi:hypothetical protein EI42_02844 [Thermosporothrix hazakensis]|uniref:AAA ATPase-like protein n=2 Tax=Thermosporothrix TaxID=768650 RepID=A0A326U7W4_THEHA|nr:ATP-binding protein [Thermosporothrix hazakensis]PZW29548.1 hypothetical protein EI42_02844 [Thermosporothrix hazakensis]BBH85836.1 hypothetical protein KTC_05870 [Thermosporothrix sp. COM3]GCE45738.1 hypothetical protein KTH_06070 [Thermosporothrix hazakensis]
MSFYNKESLQFIRRRRQQEVFRGREKELTLYQENLARDVEDEERKFLFIVTGPQGSGKTLLLRRYVDVLAAAQGVSAWIDESAEDLLEAMMQLARQLAKFDEKAFKPLFQRHALYQKRMKELMADPAGQKPPPFVAFGGMVAKMGLHIGKKIPLSGLIFRLVDEEQVEEQMKNWSAFVATKLKNKEEERLLQEPLEVLTSLFLAGARTLSASHTVGLFCDSYERTAVYLDGWLRGLLDGHYGDMPSNIVLTLAGRTEPDPERWQRFHDITTCVPLGPWE